MEKRIKNIVFDLGGVIVDLDMHSCVDAFTALGVENISDFVGLSHQEDIFHDYEVGTITTAAFCAALRDLSRCDISDEQIAKAWNKMLVGIRTDKKMKLLQLHDKYNTYLLSNTNDIHWRKTCDDLFPYYRFGAANYFEQVFLSYEMHCAKPGDTIFEMMLRQADIRASETLFLDDSPANCDTARKLGMKTLCVKPGDDWTKML